jgi:hypothetical protein
MKGEDTKKIGRKQAEAILQSRFNQLGAVRTDYVMHLDHLAGKTGDSLLKKGPSEKSQH